MKNILSYLPGFLILIGALVISGSVYQDFGISWDEPWQRQIGYVSYDYIFKGNKHLEIYEERDHGVGFELIPVIIEEKFKITDVRDVFLMRHLVQNLFFVFSMFIAYLFMVRLFKNHWIASLGFLILLFTPRIFAHSFFNSKDIPFLSMFLVSLAASAWAFRKDRPLAYLLLGVVLGYTTSIRLLSIILLAFVGLFLLIDIIQSRGNMRNMSRKFAGGILCLLGFCATVYICWPTLWEAPVANFIESYQRLSRFRYGGEVFLLGKIFPGAQIPWYYIPVWFVITVPALWLLLGITGIGIFLFSFFRQPRIFIANTRERNFLLFFLTMTAPVVMVIVLDSVVYDDWRHLYFIYPPFVLLLLYGIEKLCVTRRVTIVITILCFIQFGLLAYFMVRYHPHQQVYFNEFVPKKEEYLRKNFELDYWGTSSKAAIDYILRTDNSTDITINDEAAQKQNILLLPQDQRNRIRKKEKDEQEDYYIWFFRTYTWELPQERKVFEVKVQNSVIMAVFKMKDD